MVGIAISIVFGMLVASSRLFSPSALFFLAALCVLSSFILLKGRASSGMVFISIALTAACRFEVAQPAVRPDSMSNVAIRSAQEVELIGRVTEFPEFYAYHSDVLGVWTFPLRVESLRISNDWNSASGELDVRVSGKSSRIPVHYGDTAFLHGTMKENTFPSENKFQIQLGGSDLKILKGASRWSLVQWGNTWRNSVASRLESGLENLPIQEAVLKALVLGYRKEMPGEIMNIFRRTGTLHIFAISGLHVGIVGFLLIVLLKTMGIPRDKFGLLLVPLLTFYVISTGMKSSALRALLMASIFILAPLFRRKPDVPSSVATAGTVLLLFQPLEILSAGFIFSFTVVAFLVMAFSRVPKGWVRGSWIKAYLISLLITSIAASFASVPLTMLYFGMFSPIALLGNLMVVPLTFCIVLCGWISILFPVLSQIFNQAAVLFIDLLLGCVYWLDKMPGASFAVEPPPLMAVLLWYASLIALLTHPPTYAYRGYAIAGVVGAVILNYFLLRFLPVFATFCSAPLFGGLQDRSSDMIFAAFSGKFDLTFAFLKAFFSVIGIFVVAFGATDAFFVEFV